MGPLGGNVYIDTVSNLDYINPIPGLNQRFLHGAMDEDAMGYLKSSLLASNSDSVVLHESSVSAGFRIVCSCSYANNGTQCYENRRLPLHCYAV